jgi:hypothetical protein
MTARAATSLRHVAALGLTGLAITMNTHAAPKRTLFDFQSPNNSPAWQIVNDDVMGGVSTSVQGLRADLSRPHPDRRAAARSGEHHVGGPPDLGKAEWAIPTGRGVDQGRSFVL